MATSLDQLLATEIPDVTHTYTEKDVMLYALGVGLGSEPLDESQLDFVYEKALKVLPTMPVVMGATRIRDLALGLNYLKIVHGEQSLTLHKTLPSSATVVTKSRIAGVLDIGADKGLVVILRREVFEQQSGELLATSDMSIFARGDGGIGSTVKEAPSMGVIPERPADLVVDMPTSQRAALIYRLSGDMNPLHADPAIARQAGFDRPILHGLATYGVVGYAVLKHVCNNDTGAFKSLRGRFSAPVFPGENIQVSLWRETGGVAIRATVPERNVVVFNNGFSDVA